MQTPRRRDFLPIWVGPFEARAIALALAGTPAPRPLTHDLLKNVLEHMGVEFQKIVVSALKDNTYFARIHLLFTDRSVEIDSRPSDAIALALRFDRPIFVARDVFTEGSQRLSAPLQTLSTTVRGIEVQNLTAELADYFQLPTVEGVLVTNAAQSRGRLQRGDVILALGGRTHPEYCRLSAENFAGKSVRPSSRPTFRTEYQYRPYAEMNNGKRGNQKGV